MSDVLILGGTGFLGRNLCELCVSKGHDVTAVSRGEPSARVPNVTYRQADVGTIDALAAALPTRRFDYVINCSGKVDHRPLTRGGMEVIDAHLLGLFNVLRLIDRSAVKRFVQVGSSDQYGSTAAPQNEETREHPFSPYSFAKTAADHFLQTLWRAEKFPAVSVRLFLIYGPGQNRERFIPQVIEGCLADADFNVSPGAQRRDFCYISDVLDAFARCLDNDAVNGEVFNLASGEGVSIRDVVLMTREIVGAGSPQFGGFPYRPDENMALVADISKIERLLEWRPRVSLADGLRRTVAYYRAQADAASRQF